MNNFLDFINRDIEGKKLFLSTLPTRTKTNKKKFNETIDKDIKKYEEYKKNIYKYITVKANSLVKEKEDDHLIELAQNKVNDLKYLMFLLNPSNTYLEKMGFDSLLYQINNYYFLNFKSLNSIINGFLEKFELAGVHLTSNDFNYTCYVHEYMSSFLEVYIKRSNDYSKVSEIFEKIYWLNPEIIQHIELNFRRLIKINEKRFNSYISSLQKEEMKKNNVKSYNDCLEKLKIASNELNVKQKENVYDVIEFSKKGIIEIDHYLESSKVRAQAFQTLVLDLNVLNDNEKVKNLCDALEKLKLSINEYSNYLEFLPLFDNFKVQYEKLGKETNKKEFGKSLKEVEGQIKKKEEELDKINKKIFNGKPGVFEFGFDLKNLKMKSVLLAKELYELYKSYDEEYFKEKVRPLILNMSSIADLLNLYYSFDYFKNLAIQKVFNLTSYDEIIEYNNKFNLFAMNPDNIIVEGIPLLEDVNVSRIICNKYHLYNIHLDEEDLDIDNLKILLNKVLIVLRTYMIEKSDISIDKIWFITKVHKIQMKNDKTNDK